MVPNALGKPFRLFLRPLHPYVGFVLILLFCVSTNVFSQTQPQEQVGSVSGSVLCREGEVLAGANVVLRGTPFGAATSADGKYKITSIPVGTYTVDVTFLGFKKGSRVIKIQEGRTIAAEFVLEDEAFQIGEMQVVADRPLVSASPESKTTISSAEIEHLQASSLGDVLDVVPGVQKTANPGIGKNIQIAVRGSDTDPLTAFGTKVLVDGVPMSNNANLQFEKWTSAKTGVSTTGAGADLRTIPADNLENIEVIRGLPSVRYGELTSGLINIKTKTGSQPHRLKIKSNPDTREANFGGGVNLSDAELSYNLNAAQSERDIRKTGDEYTRLTAQVVSKMNLFDNTLSLTNKVFGQRIFDEEKPQNDANLIYNYNRGFGLNYALTGSWKYDPVSSVDFNAYVNYRRENSMRSKLVRAPLHVVPRGDTISAYVGKVETRGNEWTIGGRLEHQQTYYPGDFVHQVLFGAEVEYDANTGDGMIVDSVYNYYGLESGRYSYRFDDIPGQLIAGLYAEDKITGSIGVDFSWVIGARYEMYDPTGFNAKGFMGKADLVQARHGSYLNPRSSLIFYFDKGSQLRLSGGYVSKSPPMSSVYQPPEVIVWRDTAYSVNRYFTFNRWAEHLRGFRERQVEIGFDQTISSLFGISISGYYKQRYNQPSSISIPLFTSTSKNGLYSVYYITTRSQPNNAGWNVSKGIEFTLRSKRIDELNIDFTVSGSYNRSDKGNDNLSFDSTPDSTVGQFANYHPELMPPGVLFGYFYPSGDDWRDNILLNYYVRYTVPKLGLWATLRVEHSVWHRYKQTSLEPVNYTLLSRKDTTGRALADRMFVESIKKYPGKFLVNLNISKSLFKGAEVSFYVNNLLDDPAIYRSQLSSDPNDYVESSANPDLFYGIEFSLSIDALWR